MSSFKTLHDPEELEQLIASMSDQVVNELRKLSAAINEDFLELATPALLPENLAGMVIEKHAICEFINIITTNYEE